MTRADIHIRQSAGSLEAEQSTNAQFKSPNMFVTSTFRAMAARATLPIASSSRAARPSLTAPRRALQTTKIPRARYERFDPEPQWRAGPSGGGGRPGGGGGPNIKEYLRRRFGGDRAIYVYGIGIGGGGLYYVTQYVY